MISVNEPQLATFQAKELIKHIARLYGERKQYIKTPSIKQKQQRHKLIQIISNTLF